MNWKKVSISSKDVISGKHVQLQNLYEEVFLATKAPRDAAVFENSPTYDECVYYFSPGAVAIFDSILRAYEAVPCAAPPRAETSLIVGHSDAWDMLAAASNAGK